MRSSPCFVALVAVGECIGGNWPYRRVQSNFYGACVKSRQMASTKSDLTSISDSNGYAPFEFSWTEGIIVGRASLDV